ncbi:MAG TPA: hemerythrin family protein [Telluria sp.]|nr:hemerythrin family protein [Telluria sp.]
MKHMEWLPQMTVGNAAIDAAHKALFDEMQSLLGAVDVDLDAGFLRLSDRLECDFREEETLMESFDFPGIRNHRADHARVLSALHHVAPGDVDAAREVLQLMVQWFPLHVAAMDAELAAALRRRAGAAGAPAQSMAAARPGD